MTVENRRLENLLVTLRERVSIVVDRKLSSRYTETRQNSRIACGTEAGGQEGTLEGTERVNHPEPIPGQPIPKMKPVRGLLCKLWGVWRNSIGRLFGYILRKW